MEAGEFDYVNSVVGSFPFGSPFSIRYYIMACAISIVRQSLVL